MHFSEIDEKEKKSLFEHITRNHIVLYIWKKGQKEKKLFTPKELPWDRKAMIVEGKFEESHAGEVLINIELEGSHFFTAGKISKISSYWEVDLSSKVFKCERRENYRLRVWGRHNVDLRIPFSSVKDKSLISASAIKDSFEDKILNEFHEKILGHESSNFLIFKGRDISATGISFYLNQDFKQLISSQKQFEKVLIHFEDEVFQIALVNIIYVNDASKEIGDQYLKVAVEFVGLQEDVEQKLRQIIQKNTKAIDFIGDFEDFLNK